MTEILTERELPEFVQTMIAGQNDISIAVAFWGKEAPALLGLNKANGGRILCNLESSFCNPAAIPVWFPRDCQIPEYFFSHAALPRSV